MTVTARLVSSLIITILLCTRSAGGQPPASPPRLSDFVSVAVVEDQLRIQWISALAPPLRPFVVRGPEARWQVRSPSATRGVTPGTLYLERPPAGTRDRSHFWYIWISASPAQLSIVATRGGQAAHASRVQLTQDLDGAVHLIVVDRVGRKFVQARAASLVELRTTHARLVRVYLLPILQQLAGTDPLLPGATDVYRVFEQIESDEATRIEIDALLPKLADPDYQVRQRASRTLVALGHRAVCAVLRMDLQNLLPEQRARLLRFLQDNSRRAIEEPQVLLNNVAFLADCMEFPDDRVRRAAHRQIQILTNSSIPLHRAPTAAEWSNAADLIRERSTGR